jgi:hypothetical protein
VLCFEAIFYSVNWKLTIVFQNSLAVDNRKLLTNSLNCPSFMCNGGRQIFFVESSGRLVTCFPRIVCSPGGHSLSVNWFGLSLVSHKHNKHMLHITFFEVP